MVAVLISPQVSTRLRRKNVDCNYMYHHDFRIDFSAGESEKDALPFVHDFFHRCVSINQRLPGGAVEEIVYAEFAVLVLGAVNKIRDG